MPARFILAKRGKHGAPAADLPHAPRTAHTNQFFMHNSLFPISYFNAVASTTELHHSPPFCLQRSWHQFLHLLHITAKAQATSGISVLGL